ncbi:MAG TPA: hypothetical protein VK986_05240 [Tepidisphaeraceae bacterium]|nr:hypothetical protein [Tepidisphaeraceae bacterium]
MCRICRTVSAAVVLVVSWSAAGQTTRPAPAAPLYAAGSAVPARPEAGAADAPPPAAGGATTVVVTEPEATAPAADTAWPRAVQAFAKALADGDRVAIDAALAHKASIRRFGATHGEDSVKVVERLGKSLLIGNHAYQHPPLVMAADVAADFKVATAVPDRAKVKYLIDDEVEIKRGNATAVQWVVEQLAATQGTPVGVIVLWSGRPSPAGVTSPPLFETVFVLCRGEEVGPGEYRLTNVVYGNPLPE